MAFAFKGKSGKITAVDYLSYYTLFSSCSATLEITKEEK